MKNVIRYVFTVGLTLGIGTTALAGGATKKLTCIEKAGSVSDGAESDKNGRPIILGKYYAETQTDGKILRFQIQRKATGSFPAIKVLMGANDPRGIHEVRKNEIEDEGVDEDGTAYKRYAFGIENYEAYEANLGAVKLTLRLNDHTYAGPMGSRVFLKNSKESFEGDSILTCEGDLMFPESGALDLMSEE